MKKAGYQAGWIAATRARRGQQVAEHDEEKTVARGGTMEIREGQGLPQGNAGDSSAPVPEKCLAEEWQRDGRGVWAMRVCRHYFQHGGFHDFGSWRYNVQLPRGGTALPAPAPREESVENIPEFVEPRYWIERTTHGCGVFYRQENRKLCVHGTMNSTEAVARNCAKALNDVLYEEVTAYRAGPAPAPNPELLTALECLLAVIAAGDLIPESVSYMKYARAAVANAAAPVPRGPQDPED